MAETKKRVLVVNDEEDVITYLPTLLGDAGYDVTAARRFVRNSGDGEGRGPATTQRSAPTCFSALARRSRART